MPPKLSLAEAQWEFRKRGYKPLFDSYTNNKQKLSYQCPKHCDKIQKITLHDLKKGRGCKWCKKSSSLERKAHAYLMEKGVTFTPQYVLPGTQLRFDFMVLNEAGGAKIAIEVDGPHHSRFVRYNGISLAKAKQRFAKQKARDNFKNKWCRENGIKMIRIPYNDFDLDKYLLDIITD